MKTGRLQIGNKLCQASKMKIDSIACNTNIAAPKLINNVLQRKYAADSGNAAAGREAAKDNQSPGRSIGGNGADIKYPRISIGQDGTQCLLATNRQ